MEINATEVIVIAEELGLENSLCFEFGDNYFKISRQNVKKILYFEINNKIFEIPIKKLSTNKDKRWIKFDSAMGKMSAYFFIKETERKIAKDIIYELTGKDSYNEPIVFVWNFNMTDNKKFSHVLNIMYDTVPIVETHKYTNKTELLKAKNIICDVDNDGLYSVFFEYNGAYFTLCRNLDEKDKEIYIEKDNQNDAIIINPNNIKYTSKNGKIEFVIDNNMELSVNFNKHFIIEFPPVDFEKYFNIEKALKHIWENV